MKKHLLIAFFVLFFTSVPFALAQSTGGNFVPLAPIEGLTKDVVANSAGLANFFNNLYKYLVGLSAALAVIMIIWGGLEYSTQDSVSKKSDGKERIYQAIFGLALVLSPVLVFSIINPSILNLSISLEPLKTAPGTTPPPGPRPGPIIDPETSCTVSGSAGSVLQSAVCPSQEATQKWGERCDGNLSVSPFTTAAGGGISSYIVLCSTKTEYVFIETIGTISWTRAINRVQPLARTSANPNNGSQAIEFASACSAIGSDWATCISDLTETTSSVTCEPRPTTQIPASSGGSGKCYKETLSCRKSVPTAHCARGPSWAPFQ